MKIVSHWIIHADDMSANRLIRMIGHKIDTPLSIEQIDDAMCATGLISNIRVTIATAKVNEKCVLDYEATDFNSTDDTLLNDVNATFDKVFKLCGLTERHSLD